MRIIVSLLILLAALVSDAAADPVYDARGYNPSRAYFQGVPFERIDPMTGNLMLSFTDLRLPGNAGFDLVIARTYNSKVYRNYPNGLDIDSWAGVGWTFHLGKVSNGELSHTGPVVIELSDGSEHRAYPHITPPAGCGNCFVTKEHWIYDKNTNQLSLPNGRRYTFLRTGTHPSSPQQVRYVTEIRDPFENVINVTYQTGVNPPVDAMQQITQHLGGGVSRNVTFQTSSGKLLSMTANSRTWNYNVSGGVMHSMTPPSGPAWGFLYSSSELTKVTMPYGGTITYGYTTNLMSTGGQYFSSRSIDTRSVAGRGMEYGVWHFQYHFDQVGQQFVVSDSTTVFWPCVNQLCPKDIYRYTSVGPYSAPTAPWRIGLLRMVERHNGDYEIAETREITWEQSLPISNTQETIGIHSSPMIYAPLLKQVTTSRRGRTWRTTHTYNQTQRFNDYGRPERTDEVGESGTRSRRTEYTYRYGFSPRYIVDKVATITERLEANAHTAGPETFTTSYDYNTTTGFMNWQDLYGVRTTYSPGATGNVATATDAKSAVTQYTYEYGAEKSVTIPRAVGGPYFVTRAINWDGRIAEETKRGFVTKYEYDWAGRVTKMTPPAVNDPLSASPLETVIAHDLVSASDYRSTSTRGSTVRTTYYDGFGRIEREANAAGVTEDTTYDLHGNISFKSYPYASGGTRPGTAITYDVLGRRRTLTHGDGNDESFTYDDVNHQVDHRDERDKITRTTFRAYGDPGEARPVSVQVQDANQTLTTYDYSVLGRLLNVAGPTGIRSWVYNSKNQLTSAVDPESGTTVYTPDAVGNITQSTNDNLIYTYDEANRVKTRVGVGVNDAYTYDAAGNRTQINSIGAMIEHQFDAAGRLRARRQTINQRMFETRYVYDGNDRILRLSYPSNSDAPTGTLIGYEYDTSDRITAVKQYVEQLFNPSQVRMLASSITWHPSGQLGSFIGGDSRLQMVTYDDRHRPLIFGSSGLNQDLNSPLVYNIWGYDPAGNVSTVTDNVAPSLNQTIEYDNLNRVRTVTGPGAGTYAYDAAGNRLQFTFPNGTHLSYTGGGGTVVGNRYPAVTGPTGMIEQYLYYNNGNLQSRLEIQSNRTTTFTYTATNMLSQVTTAGQTTNYAYDGDGNRVWRNHQQRQYRFEHDASGRLLSEFDLTPSVSGLPRWVADYVYLGDRLLAKVGCDVTVLDPVVLVGAGGGASYAGLRTPHGCGWNAQLPSWIQAPEVTGVGGGTVGLQMQVAANTGSTSRTATVTVGGRPIRVTQGATACFAELTPGAASEPSEGITERPVQVNSPSACGWNATSSATWLSVSQGTGRTGPGSFYYAVQANPGATQRVGTITIAGAGWSMAYTVTQLEMCVMTVQPPTSAWIPGAGGQTTFTVNANRAGCSWNMVSVSQPWVTFAGGQWSGSGTTPVPVTLNVAANTAPTARSAVANVLGGATHTIWQSGVSTPIIGIDAPAPNAVLPVGTFRLSGYAGDWAAPSGTGAAQMAVYVNGALGPAVTMGQYHAYAASVAGPQFANAGYFVDLNLPAGTHSIVVYMQSSVSLGVTSVSRTVIINRPPTVTIPAPTNPFVVNAGTTVNIVSSASDPDAGDGINRVEYYYNGAFLGQSTVAPSYQVSIPNAPAGTFTLVARAFDNRGYSTNSAPVTLIVNGPPAVTVTMAATQSRAAVTFQSSTSDPGSPTGQAVRVDYYLGTLLLGTSTAGNPFTFVYNNAPVPPGVYTIRALATDNYGLQTWSANFNLTLY